MLKRLGIHGLFCLVVLCGYGPAQVWANQVIAAREGSLITIFGDAAANTIVVSQNVAGDLLVAGKNGTTVNGQPSVWFKNLTLNAMEIRMEGGNDQVTISRLSVAVDLFIDLGAGNDRVLTGAYPSTIGSNLMVLGESGNDLVRLTGWTVSGDLFIDGQVGPLTAELTGSNVGFNLTIIGDLVGDKVTVASTTVAGTTSIETKSGIDRVTVSQFSGFDLFVNTDQGADIVSLADVLTLEDVGVVTGTQNDQLTMTNVASSKNILVSMDAGNDWFTGTNVSAAFDLVAEGGAGTDTLVDMGIAGGVKTEIKEFEVFF